MDMTIQVLDNEYMKVDYVEIVAIDMRIDEKNDKEHAACILLN